MDLIFDSVCLFFRFLLLLLRSRRFSIPLDEHMYESDEHCAAGRLKRWQQWTALSLTMISSRGQEQSQGNAIETGHRTVATEQVTSRDCTSLINKDPFDQCSALTRTYQQNTTKLNNRTTQTRSRRLVRPTARVWPAGAYSVTVFHLELAVGEEDIVANP